jgi:hypothetical protein
MAAPMPRLRQEEAPAKFHTLSGSWRCSVMIARPLAVPQQLY